MGILLLLILLGINKELKEVSWQKVNFGDEKITIRFDAYLPFLDSKHDDSDTK